MLRTIALIAAVVGGTGSVAFLLQAGNRNSSLIVLVTLFSMWVASPFIALVLAILKSARWAATTRTTLYGVTIVLTLASLAIYSGLIDLKPAGSPNTFLFVAVPPALWAFAAVAVSMVALVSRKPS